MACCSSVESPSFMNGLGNAWREVGQSLEPAPPDSTTESNRIFVLVDRVTGNFTDRVCTWPGAESRNGASVAFCPF
jgi:hypothetical protein